MANDVTCRRCGGQKVVTVKDAKTGEKKSIPCLVCAGTGFMQKSGIVTK